MKLTLTIDRFKVWFAIALLGVVSLSSFWVLQVIRSYGDDQAASGAVRTEPDYYVEKFQMIKISSDGKTNYQIAGDRLSHLPQTEQLEIQSPRIQSYQADKAQMSLQADRGVIEQKSNSTKPARAADAVNLYGNVIAVRPESAAAQFLKMQTEYLMLIPDQNVMKTDQAIFLQSKHAEIRAVGMVANNATQQLELLHKVRMKLGVSPTKSATQ